jgi:hypothetical protein
MQDDNTKPLQVICFSIVPCCVGKLCSPERKEVYSKLLRSFSFAFIIVEIAMLVISLCFGGFAPTSINPMLGPQPEVLVAIGAKVRL